MTDTRVFSFDPKAALIAYHAAVEAQDFATIAAMFHPDIAYESPGVGTVTGRDAVIDSFRAYFAEHPDQTAVDDRVERVAPLAAHADWRLTATKRSTGERIERAGEEVVFFDEDGLIVRVIVADR